MDKSTRTICACLLLAGVSIAYAGSTKRSDGHWLAGICMSDGVYEMFGCEMYLEGALDALNRPAGQLCFDNQRPTAAELRTAVLRYIEANPGRLHLPRIELVDQAFQEAWPSCQ